MKILGSTLNGFIAMTLTREDIANIVGTAKETCIRTLTSFKKQGWVVTEGKRIKIEDHTALLTTRRKQLEIKNQQHALH